MAIINPQVPLFDRAQDGTVTVTLSSASDISGWAVSAILRAYAGGTAIATKTVGSGITSSYSAGTTTQTWVITFTDDDLDIAPGGYVWDFRRTDSGAEYQIVEPSAFIIRPDAVTGGPTLTNLSEFTINALGGTAPSTDALAKFYTQLLFAAEARVRTYTGRQLTRGSYTEYPVSTGTKAIQLKETPVSSTAMALYLDLNAHTGQTGGDFAAATLLTYDTDYTLDLTGSTTGESLSGIVYRTGQFWPARLTRPAGPDGNLLSHHRRPWPGILKASYTGGFNLVPYDLKAAVWTIASQLAFIAPYGSVFMSESGEGRSYSRMSPDIERTLFASVENTLGPYRAGRLLVG